MIDMYDPQFSIRSIIPLFVKVENQLALSVALPPFLLDGWISLWEDE